MLFVLLSIKSMLTSVTSSLSSAYFMSKSHAAGVLPLFESDAVFATFMAAALLLPTLYLVIFADFRRDLPPRLPVLIPALTGQLKLGTHGPIYTLLQGYRKLGDIFRIKLAHRGFTVVVGREATRVFFETSDREMSQREVYGFTKPVFGPNIVYDAPPGIMIQQLKFVRHGLQGDAMRKHAEGIFEETKLFFAEERFSDPTREHNLHEVLSELTIMTASRCLLGKEVRGELYNEFAGYYEALNAGMTPFSVFFPNFPTKAHRNRDRARVEIVKLFSKVIARRRAKEAKEGKRDPNKQPEDFLEMLMTCSYRDGSRPTDDEIVGMLLAALFAGQHTSSITSTWMGLLVISEGPKLIQRLLDEQKEVLAATDGQITFENANKMDLMHACLKETLRLFPPLILLMRYVRKAQKYRGYTIPAGDVLIASPPVSHRIPEVFPNPEKYDPDRFYARNEGAEKHDFIAFGGGRHTCLGERFGFLQIKTIWSTLLREFDFELVTTPFVPECNYTSIVAGPKGDMRVRMRRKPKEREYSAE